jgi:hypothetical protein
LGLASTEVEEFARLLVTQVRDMAIEGCDISRHPDANGAVAQRWRRKIQAGDVDALLEEIIPDCVDSALFYLLQAIDQGELKISFTSSSGKTVELEQAGESEMSGWYMTTDGWRTTYSKERVNDDFADLELP